MKFETAGSPYGFCVFCEDIRQEINGKHTYVGVIISSDLNVLGTLPAVIGKFSINASYRQRLADGLEPLTIQVHMPGDDEDKPTATVDFSLEEVAAKLPPAPEDIEDPFIGVGIGFEFNPLEVKKEGRIIVSALKAGKRYRLGGLRIQSRPPLPPPPETT
jgi:hypothetical protein